MMAHSYRPIERVAVLGTGLMGTSVAMAAARAGASVTGWDADPETTARAAALGGFMQAASSDEAVEGADLVVVCTPIHTIAPVVAVALAGRTFHPDCTSRTLASLWSRNDGQLVSPGPGGPTTAVPLFQRRHRR